MEQRRFPVMVDLHQGYDVKPSIIPNEVGRVRNRMKNEEPRMFTSTSLLGFIRAGHAWQPGCYRKGEFLGQQVYGLDFDKPELLMPDEALLRLDENGLSSMASFAYFTYTATAERPKYRLVLVDTEVMKTEAMAKKKLRCLLGLFPEADQACKDPNRMFFGSDDRFAPWDIDGGDAGIQWVPGGGEEDGESAGPPDGEDGRAAGFEAR